MEKSNGYGLTIYASSTPSLHFPRSAAGGKKEERTRSCLLAGRAKKFLGISNTPEVFIAEAGHVSGARRQKFEITCSDARIRSRTRAHVSFFLSLSLSLSRVPIFSLSLIRGCPRDPRSPGGASVGGARGGVTFKRIWMHHKGEHKHARSSRHTAAVSRESRAPSMHRPRRVVERVRGRRDVGIAAPLSLLIARRRGLIDILSAFSRSRNPRRCIRATCAREMHTRVRDRDKRLIESTIGGRAVVFLGLDP